MKGIRLKPCDDLDGALRRDKREGLELRKRKDENTLNRECDKMNNLRKEEIKPLEERRISGMPVSLLVINLS